MIRNICIAVTAVTALTACDKTNWESSIFRDKMGADPEVGYVVTDAKQRLVISAPNKRAGEPGEPDRVVCAEPSPDVSQALSEAMKLTASVNITGKGSGAGGLDRSFAQSVAQLGERLAVIQLLRDKMYRACEAYANGAVGASGYTLMLARLDKTMVSMLSAEMAAGAFGRNLAQIGGHANTSGADPEALKDAVAKAAAADKKLAEAEAADPRVDKDVEAARAEQSAANANLQSVIVAAASSSAQSVLATHAIGTISGRAGPIPANASTAITAIHQSYMDDHGIEPLVDACVVAMDGVTFDKEDRPQLTQLSQEIENLDNEIGTLKAAESVNEEQLKEKETQRESAQSQIIRLLSSKSAFAAFCAERIFSNADHHHSFIRQLTTLKRDLRGSRVTSPDGRGKVIAHPIDGDSKLLELVEVHLKQKAHAEKCAGLEKAVTDAAFAGGDVDKAKKAFADAKCDRKASG